MKKATLNKIIFRALALTAALICLAGCVSGFAEENEKKTVYASKADQEAIQKLIEEPWYSELDLSLLMPAYTIDLEAYHAGDEIRLYPELEDGYLYILNHLPDSFVEKYNEACAPATFLNLRYGAIVVKNGEAYDTWTDDGGNWDAGTYADYAEDIRLALGRENLISPEYVRLVSVPGFGYCYYIHDDKDECFVSTAELITYSAFFRASAERTQISGHSTIAVIHVGEELAKYAEEYRAYKKAYAEWQSQQKEMTYGGSGFSYEIKYNPETFPAEHYRQIEDVQAYLGINLADYAMHFPKAFVKKTPVWPFLAGAGAVVAAGAAVLLILRKKKSTSDKVQTA